MSYVKRGAVASPYPVNAQGIAIPYWVKVKARLLERMEATTVRVSLFTGGVGPRFTTPQLDTLLTLGGRGLNWGAAPPHLQEVLLSSREDPTPQTVEGELGSILPYIAHVTGELGYRDILFVYELGNEPNNIKDENGQFRTPADARNRLLSCLKFLKESKDSGRRFGNGGLPLPDNLIWGVGMPSGAANAQYLDTFLGTDDPRGGLLQGSYIPHLVTVNCYGDPDLTPSQYGDPYSIIRAVRDRNGGINIKVAEANIGSPTDEERAQGDGYYRGEHWRAFVDRFATPPTNDPVYRGVDTVCIYAVPCVADQIYNTTFNTARRIAGYGPTFPDVPETDAASAAVENLAALRVVRGYGDGDYRFGVNDTIKRAEMAAVICRSMPTGDAHIVEGLPGIDTVPSSGPAETWAGEDHGNSFTDRGPVDNELWRDVGTLAYYNVALGYSDGTYQPTEPVLYAQMISFIARAMVRKGFWQQQPDDPALYPNIPAASGHRQDLVTYARYTGPVSDTTDPRQPWLEWDAAAPRGWCARALWQGIRNDLFRMPPFTIPFFAPTNLTFTSRYIEFVGGIPQVRCTLAPNTPPQPL